MFCKNRLTKLSKKSEPHNTLQEIFCTEHKKNHLLQRVKGDKYITAQCYFEVVLPALGISHSNFSNSASAAFHDGLRIAYMMKGMTTKMMAPIIKTKYHTLVLPTAI